MKTENIVTLTMNPAIDMGSYVKKVMATHKVRCEKVRRDPGGGGINVARALKRYGCEPLAIFPVGGPSGLMLERLVAAENVRHQTFNTVQECRANFTVNEDESGEQFRFVLPGPTLSEDEWQAGLGLMTAACSNGYAIGSGSLPDGVPADFYARLSHNLRGKAKLILDTSGDALKESLDTGGNYIIKPSLSEFVDYMGVSDKDPDQKTCVEAARKMVADGKTEIVALTLGEDGAILVSKDKALQARPPKVTVHGTVGAGDSFLAALTLRMAQGWEMEKAFQQAIASGTAALASAGTGLCDPKMVEELAPQVQVNVLP